jgi:hypothetical protein
MSEVGCPNCGLAVTIVPNLAGQTVSCPRCQAHFVMPAGGGPIAQPVGPSFVSVYQSGGSRKFRPAKSLLDIFDFRFEAFVTPIIIRTTWVLVLIGACLYSAWALYSALETESKYQIRLPEMTATEPATKTSPTVIKKPPTMEELEAEAKRSETMRNLVWFGFKLIALCLSLLWVRVSLEMTIVAFNIANSLQSIDQKTKG